MQNETRRAVRLTKRTVDGAVHAEKPFIVWDSDLKGFGLKVAARPGTTKTFVVKYRVGGGRAGTQRQFKVGTYGALTPEKARARAEEILAQVALGEDPQGDRAEGREAWTLGKLCDEYLRDGCATKKASTKKLDAIRLEVMKRLIGNLKITELTGADVERMMNAIATGRLKGPVETVDVPEGQGPKPLPGDKARGGLTAATKAVKLLRAIFNWAVANKVCKENPCLGIRTFPDVRRERFLSLAELGKLGDALTVAEAEPDPKGRRAEHVRIVRLLALTGARKGEIARLRWTEVKNGYLQLEDSKTGRKVVPLGAAAQELLAGAKRGNSPWVFPDPEYPDEPIRNLDWAWVGFRKRAGLEDVRIHDLRHSFASAGIAGGATLFLIGKVLGHAHAATTHRYAHLADDPVKAAADRISSSIDAAMKGGSAEVKSIGDGR